MLALRAALLSALLMVLAGGASGQISGDIVKIGVLNDQSGLYSDLTGYGAVVAARMAVEDFGGGVDGTPVEVIFADHQNKPDIGAGIAREWIDSEGVDAIADVPTSSVALAVNEVVRDRNRVFLVSGAGTSRLTGDACTPNTVHWTYDNWALAHGTGRAEVELGGDTYIGLANAGGDTTNAIKQAVEFGITASGQRLVPLLIGLHDVESLGLKTAQGLLFTEGFYWDLNEDTRAFSERFAARNQGKPPSQAQGLRCRASLSESSPGDRHG